MLPTITEGEARRRLCPASFGPDSEGGARGDECIGRHCMAWRYASVRQLEGTVAFVTKPEPTAQGFPDNVEGVCLALPFVLNVNVVGAAPSRVVSR